MSDQTDDLFTPLDSPLFQQPSSRFPLPPQAPPVAHVPSPSPTSRFPDPAQEQRLQTALQPGDPTPEEAAKIYALSTKTGVPFEVVQRNLKQVEAEAARQDFNPSEFRRKSPVLAEWLASDRFHAALAQDDIPPLGMIERVLGIGRNLLGVVGAGTMHFVASQWGNVRGLAENEAADAAGRDLVNNPSFHYAPFQQMERSARDTFVSGARGVAEFARQMQVAADYQASWARGEQRHAGPLERMTYSGLESVASMAPSLLLGEVAGPLAATGLLAEQSFGSSYTEARDTLGTDAATRFAGREAGLMALVGAAPTRNILKGLAEGKTVWSNLAHQFLVGLPLIQAQGRLSSFNQWASLPDNQTKSFVDWAKEQPGAMLDELLPDLVMMGGQTILAHGTEAVLSRLGLLAQKSKLGQLAPDKLEDFIKLARVQGLAPDTVYLDTKKFTTYFQDRHEDPAEWAAKLTGDKDALKHATEENTPLRVPTEKYVVQLGRDQEHNEFFAKNARLLPSQKMTSAEATQAEADLMKQADEIQQGVTRAVSGEETPAERNSPIRKAIVAATLADSSFHAMAERERMDPVELAHIYAAGLEPMIRTLATKKGEDPVDVINRYNISVGQAGHAALIQAVQDARAEAPPSTPRVPQPGGEDLAAPEQASGAGPQAPGSAEGAAGAGPDETTLNQGKGPKAPEMAVSPAVVTPDGNLVVSGRRPSAVRSQVAAEPVPLRMDLDVIKSSDTYAGKAADKLTALGVVSPTEGTGPPDAVLDAAVRRFKSNLKFLYDRMPPAIRDRARRWYVGAHAIGTALAEHYGVTKEKMFGVLASLSPQKDWFMNVALARQVTEVFQYAEQHNPVFTDDLVEHHRANALDNITERVKEITKRTKNGGPLAAEAYRHQAMVTLEDFIDHARGRAWADMHLTEQAALARTVAERTLPQNYRVILPEGEEGDYVMTAGSKNKPPRQAKLTWGSFDTVEAAIRILRDGTPETIHDALGFEHKVRSFFNNLSDPWNPNFVTIDTHAVGAALMRLVTSNTDAVKASMGQSQDSYIGASGINGVFAEAYFQLAKELGIRPNELQSITWEGIRGLFGKEQKRFGGKELRDEVNGLWQDALVGKMSEEAVRERIAERAGGIDRPAWADTEPRVAYDESGIRRGDVLAGRPGFAAGRGDGGASSVQSARELSNLSTGAVVPREAVLDQARADARADKKAGRGALADAIRRTTATRTLDSIADAAARAFESESHRRTRKGPVKPGEPSKHVVAIFTPTGLLADGFAKAGFGTSVFHEMRGGDRKAAGAFREAIVAARGAIGDDAPQVAVYSVPEYMDMRTFLSPNGRSGFALKLDTTDGVWDLVSVFNNNTDGGPRIANSLVALAVQLTGGNVKLDCFDTSLPERYAVNGFRVITRDPWNEQYKPDGWNKEHFAEFNRGEPAIVYMRYDREALKTGPVTLYQDPVPTATTDAWATSRLQTAVKLATQNAATGAQWKGLIKNSKLGVNADEFLMTHVDDLEDGAKYTKAQVLEYLQKNGVQVAWTTLSDAIDESKVSALAQKYYDQELDRLRSRHEFEPDIPAPRIREYEEDGTTWYEVEDGETFDTREEADAEAASVHDRWVDAAAAEFDQGLRDDVSWSAAEQSARDTLALDEEQSTKYGEYSLDNGASAEPGSYREVFLQGNPAVTPKEGFDALSKDDNQFLKTDSVRFWRDYRADRSTDGGKGAKRTIQSRIQELEQLLTPNSQRHGESRKPRSANVARDRRELQLLKLIDFTGQYAFNDSSDGWQDGHEAYSGIANPIVRLRFNVRRGEAPVTAHPIEIVARNERFYVQRTGIAEGEHIQSFATREAAEEAFQRFTRGTGTIKQQAPYQRLMFLEEVQPPSLDNQKLMPVLYVKNWRELAMKWAIRHAAEMGYDGIAWTTGQQQLDRYKLTRHVRQVEWRPSILSGEFRTVDMVRTDGGRTISLGIDVDGMIVRSANLGGAEGHKLADIIGVEVAKQIDASTNGVLEGQGLEVGNRGLARVYDEDLPNAAKRLPVVKKNGGRVETTTIFRGVNQERSEQPVLKLTPEMRAAALEGQTLFQGDNEHRGGFSFSPTGVRIEFLKTADLSTFMHETAHLYMHILDDMVTRLQVGDADSWTAGQRSLIEDQKRILAWVGAASYGTMTRDQHEQFARGFEAYLMRGIAPTAELRVPFQHYRTWMTDLYKSMTTLNVDLQPDVVDIFNRMMATDDAIEAARKDGEATPIFSTAEQAGMQAIEWSGYQKVAQAAHDDAKDELQQKLMREYARERSAWWKAKQKTVRAEVEQELSAKPEYRALKFLQQGVLPDGTNIEEHKLSRDSIVQGFGEDRLKSLPKPWVYTTEGGLDVEHAAELLGFSSGDELLRAITKAEKLDAAVGRETVARMQRQYGNMRADGTIREAARAAVENDSHDALMTAELKALRRMATQARPIVAAARAQDAAEEASARRAMKARISETTASAEQLRRVAEDRLGKVVAKDVKPSMYWVAAKSAAAESERAMHAGRYEDAVAAKTKQRLSTALFRAAERAVAEVDNVAAYAKRLGERSSQARLGKAGESYQQQVNAVLAKFDFEPVTLKTLKRRQTLVEWLKARQAEDLPIDIPADIVDAAQKTNFQNLTMNDLRAVVDTLKGIEHLARLKNELLTDKKGAAFDAARAELLASISKWNRQRKVGREFTAADERKMTVGDFFGAHKKISELAQQLDGYQELGPAYRRLVLPIHEAQTAELLRRAAEGDKFNAIIKKHYPGTDELTWHKKQFIPALNDSLRKETVLAIALNWGNETSRDRVLNDPKLRVTRQQVEGIFDTMDQRDWQFVQDTLDFVNTLWPEISDKMFRVTGLRPEKVEAVPVDTKFGRFAGGYYPLKGDDRVGGGPAEHALIQDAKTVLQGAYMRQSTKRGHEKARVETAAYPLRLDMSVLFGHLDQVIHDLTHHEPLIDVTRMLRDKDVRDAIYAVGGKTMFAQFRAAYDDIARGKPPGGPLDQAANFIKSGAQVAGLGFNWWTAAQQPLGIFNGMARVGPVWVARGMFRWMRDAASMENTAKWVYDISPFMRSRSDALTQDIADLRRRLQAPGGWFDRMVREVSRNRITRQNLLDAYVWHIEAAQKVADFPTWLGAYEKATSEGVPQADAVTRADLAVRDAQGSGQLADLSSVQRGTGLARLFMTFYSYGNTVYNATSREYGRLKLERSPLAFARFMRNLSLLYLFPAIGTVALGRLLKGQGQDDDGPVELSQQVLQEMGGTALNTMVLVRELGALARGGGAARGYEGPAGTRLFSNTMKLYQAGTHWWDTDFEEGGADLFDSLNATSGVLLKYPSGQVQRSIDGFVALQEGRTQNPLSLVFGPPPKAK